MALVNKMNTITNHGIRNPRFSRRGKSKLDHRASQVVIQRNPYEQKTKPEQNSNKQRAKTTNLYKIATWNVTTLYEAGKLANLLLEMEALDINIMGVSETRWPGTGKYITDGYAVYFSGNQDHMHRNGVSIIMKENTSKHVTNFIPLSDRVIMIQLKAEPVNLNIIQVYAPTADKDEQEIEEFYHQIEEVLKTTKKHEIIIIMGDFNAKVGQKATDNITGNFGLGERNQRGERLIEFCQETNLTITNTWFQLPERRLYTWRSPMDGHHDRTVRNQIDYILINHRFRNSIKTVKTYPGADINSNHNLLCSKFQVKLKKPTKSPKPNRMCLDPLRNPEVRELLSQQINKEIHKIRETTNDNTTINEYWHKIQGTIIEQTKETLKPTKRLAKNEWMTQEILGLMELRREHKNKNKDTVRYCNINNIIKNKIKQAKEKWLENCCKEVEDLEKNHDSFNLHKKLKYTSGIKKPKHVHLLKDPDGNLLDQEQQCKEWERYVTNLFDDANRGNMTHTICDNSVDRGPSILKAEVEKAIQQAKNNRAPGPDLIPVELLKILDEESITCLTTFFNKIYSEGKIPDDWLESLFITLPKKSRPTNCSDFRLISLMSHTLKILLRITQNRIFRLCESNVSDKQFGFRSGLGTREALFCMRVLLQKSCEFRKNIYVCFIDFEKAFDRVQHEPLFEYMEAAGLDNYDIRLLKYLYYNQVATIRIEDSQSQKLPIKRGVRQGCVLSPTLFNMYSEEIFKEALDDRPEGVRIGGETINNIRYADDTAILAENPEDLQTLLNLVNEASGRRGLKINTTKTKWMAVGKINENQRQIWNDGEMIERVDHFKYLGSWLNTNADSDEEITTRIAIARKAFTTWKPALCNRNLSMNLRKRVLRCYVWSILLYGCETWTLKATMMNRLEAFELWCYRRILKISWISHTSNEDVLRMMSTERQLLNTIKRRKTEYFGHIIRGPKYQLLRLIIQGKVEGRRWIGRKKLSWLRNIRQWCNLTVEELFRAAADREGFQEIISMMSANV